MPEKLTVIVEEAVGGATNSYMAMLLEPVPPEVPVTRVGVEAPQEIDEIVPEDQRTVTMPSRSEPAVTALEMDNEEALPCAVDVAATSVGVPTAMTVAPISPACRLQPVQHHQWCAHTSRREPVYGGGVRDRSGRGHANGPLSTDSIQPPIRVEDHTQDADTVSTVYRQKVYPQERLHPT